MKDKKLITKRPAGGRRRKRPAGALDREKYAYMENEKEVYAIEANQFFITYSDGSREVRDVEIDYSDYVSNTYENIKTYIAKNIARLRTEKGLTCEDIAEKVGVSRQYISQLENGEKNVSLEILSKIASSFGVNIEFIIREKPFASSNIYIDKLVSEIRELDLHRQKELCAKIIEELWIEYSKRGWLMRYHKYKHKPGGYIKKRNRLGGISIINSKNFASVIRGYLGCLLPCMSIPAIIGLLIIFF